MERCSFSPSEEQKAKSCVPEDFLSSLNEEQKQAVLNIEGPTLILAGAGTGKTRTITARMGYIIKQGFALPSQILAVTFTNKAAREMLARVNEIANTSGIWLGTFHAVAARILRNNAGLIGLRSDFTIVGPDDQLQLIKAITNDIQPGYPSDGYKLIMHVIQRWKERGLTPSDITDTEMQKQSDSLALSVYHAYQSRLQSLNFADFGDLLLYNINMFGAHSSVLAYYQEQFRYIMVDEYQDINTVQYLWLRLLAQKHKNICCVGDDDQSIYSWRGAEVGNILRFSDDFPQAKIIRLEYNYRSTSNILSAASAIINNNKSRLGKKLWTTNQAGQKVNLMKFWDSRLEAQYISEYIMNTHEYQLNEIAILVRAGFQTRVFEEYFIRYGISYRIIGSTRFYDRQEIRDLISYLRVVTNPSHDIAFERIMNKPKRQLGTSTLNKIRTYATENNLSLVHAGMALIDGGLLPDRASNTLKGLLLNIDRWREMLNTDSLADTMKAIARDSGYIEMLKNNGEPGASKLENIKELFTALIGFDDVTKFLEHISLVTEIESPGEEDTHVCVMTLHAAKGLEFPVVFLPGWEEGIFPHEKSLHDITGKSLEEERRLAYVGITRAREKLFISCAAVREINNWKQPMKISRFIRELPAEYVQVVKNVSDPL